VTALYSSLIRGGHASPAISQILIRSSAGRSGKTVKVVNGYEIVSSISPFSTFMVYYLVLGWRKPNMRRNVVSGLGVCLFSDGRLRRVLLGCDGNLAPSGTHGGNSVLRWTESDMRRDVMDGLCVCIFGNGGFGGSVLDLADFTERPVWQCLYRMSAQLSRTFPDPQLRGKTDI